MSTPNLGIDDEDFALSLVPDIEKSLGIRFEQHDFEHVKTYGQMCDVVRSRLPLQTTDTCTTQQAFYKLRNVLQSQLPVRRVHPASALADVLPPQWLPRRRAAQKIQEALGMELRLLGMPGPVEVCFTSLLVLSFIGTPIAGMLVGSMGALIGVLGFGAAVLGICAGNYLGTTVKYATLREVVEVMSTQFYRKSRRDPNSFNNQEIKPLLDVLVGSYTAVDSPRLLPDAVLL